MKSNGQAKKRSRLEGIVTGASKGIGAAIARDFGLEGANVLVNYNQSKDEAGKFH